MFATLIFLATVSFAAGGIDNVQIKQWTTDDGLPGNHVNTICRTEDGYLWIGTREGIARFDGVNFTVFTAEDTPAFKETGENCLILEEEKQGRLWAGMKGGILRREGGAFLNF